jgi:hypothetical protein
MLLNWFSSQRSAGGNNPAKQAAAAARLFKARLLDVGVHV